MTIRQVLDRIDTLLTTTAGVSRALSITGADGGVLRKELDRAEGSASTGSDLGPSYVLRWGGDADAVTDLISQPAGSKSAEILIEISAYAGGGEDAGSDVQEVDRHLADIWEQVVQVVQDPNNRSYVTTGLIQSSGFRCRAPARVGDRLVIAGSFRVRYDLTYAAL